VQQDGGKEQEEKDAINCMLHGRKISNKCFLFPQNENFSLILKCVCKTQENGEVEERCLMYAIFYDTGQAAILWHSEMGERK
jgi:hypothetical protein